MRTLPQLIQSDLKLECRREGRVIQKRGHQLSKCFNSMGIEMCVIFPIKIGYACIPGKCAVNYWKGFNYFCLPFDWIFPKISSKIVSKVKMPMAEPFASSTTATDCLFRLNWAKIGISVVVAVMNQGGLAYSRICRLSGKRTRSRTLAIATILEGLL